MDIEKPFHLYAPVDDDVVSNFQQTIFDIRDRREHLRQEDKIETETCF